MAYNFGYKRNKFVYPLKIWVIDEPVASIPILAELPETPFIYKHLFYDVLLQCLLDFYHHTPHKLSDNHLL